MQFNGRRDLMSQPLKSKQYVRAPITEAVIEIRHAPGVTV
jgi:hypothetical protein